MTEISNKLCGVPLPLRTVTELLAVADERERQDTKWRRSPGNWPAPHEIKLTVLVEEVGEVARAILERSSQRHLHDELIQVAAVAVAWAECLNPEDE